jgi:hypothetical protein
MKVGDDDMYPKSCVSHSICGVIAVAFSFSLVPSPLGADRGCFRWLGPDIRIMRHGLVDTKGLE